MTFQKQDLLIEMLYNQEDILTWDFTKIRKVKNEVAPI